MAVDRASLRETLRVVGVAAAAGLFLAGWWYTRNLWHFGEPLLGNWRRMPGADLAWWQQPGFHTPAYYTGFGESLRHAYQAGFHSFWDGVYSTFWADGGIAGRVFAADRHGFWDYHFTSAGMWLGLPETALLVAGGVLAGRDAFRDPDPRRRAVLSFLLTACFAVVFSLALLTAQLPFFAQAKASYALCLVAPLAVFFAQAVAAADDALARIPPLQAVLTGAVVTILGCFWLGFAASRGRAATLVPNVAPTMRSIATPWAVAAPEPAAGRPFPAAPPRASRDSQPGTRLASFSTPPQRAGSSQLRVARWRLSGVRSTRLTRSAHEDSGGDNLLVGSQSIARTSLVLLGSLGLLLSLSDRGHAQQSGCGTNPFQDWYFVDPTRQFVRMTGTIARRVKYNVPDETIVGFYNDYDWNIYIDPDDASLLVNSRNRANSSGFIEAEVQSRGRPHDLADLFPVGTRVEAYGEWVEDMGHDPSGGFNTGSKGGKTELHPLYWMRTLDSNPTIVFVAQDDSGRFVDAQNVLWSSHEIPLAPQFPEVTPWSPVPSRTHIFEEGFEIARGTSRASASPSGYTSWAFLDSWSFYNCDSSPREICGDFCGHSPYYVGTVSRTTGSLLSETLTYSVSTDVHTGQKLATLHVVAELDSPPEQELASSRWEYESSAGTVHGVVEEVKSEPPHRIEFTMPYAPALGYHQSAWRVSVSGSSHAHGQRQPSTSQEMTATFARTLVTEGRTYAIGPSAISLDHEAKGVGVCGDVAYLRVDESRLLPEISLRGLRWFVKVLKDSEGFTGASPVDTEVTPGSPLDDPGFTAETYRSTEERRLDIQWKRLPSGQPNLAQIVVTARGVTELGEEVATHADLSPQCGLGTYSASQIADYNYRLMARKGITGELYKVARRARWGKKRWLEAFAKFLYGHRLSPDEERLLVEHARQGSALPPAVRKELLRPISSRGEDVDADATIRRRSP